MVSAADRMGIPREFTLLLSMMVRYLFLFWAVLKRIRVAQQTRLFDIWNKDVPRRWVLEQVGNSMSSIFIRSYEQGERTYISMLCRGYGSGHVKLYFRTKIKTPDVIFPAPWCRLHLMRPSLYLNNLRLVLLRTNN